ncbi:uncharacterized protein L201_005754 [Kwoniella dendrophila CBS 6074]|uniref:DUF1764 domain-containing protein n=1 Tax=Kwoniella dendrophila CBS 6074 TaxID=1295534 RepID=A0AAX4JZV8_9TREE
MGKKSSSSTVTTKETKNKAGISKQLPSKQKESTSIDDIFAAPKKRKIDEVKAATKANKSKKDNAESNAKSKNAVASSSKPKTKAKEPLQKKKSKSIPEPRSDSDDDDEGEDDDNDDDDDESIDFEDFDSDEEFTSDEEEGNAATTRKVEEIVDPSSINEIRKRIEAQRAKTAQLNKNLNKKSNKDKEDDEAFADSRGTGPRRKTEEGFLIYKEAELAIDPTAGGTPLCPFDCDCCF